jgi:hypothetical protein
MEKRAPCNQSKDRSGQELNQRAPNGWYVGVHTLAVRNDIPLTCSS